MYFDVDLWADSSHSLGFFVAASVCWQIGFLWTAYNQFVYLCTTPTNPSCFKMAHILEQLNFWNANIKVRFRFIICIGPVKSSLPKTLNSSSC